MLASPRNADASHGTGRRKEPSMRAVQDHDLEFRSRRAENGAENVAFSARISGFQPNRRRWQERRRVREAGSPQEGSRPCLAGAGLQGRRNTKENQCLDLA